MEKDLTAIGWEILETARNELYINLPYLDAAFEVASAMGTVGLTTGITPDLSLFSHLLLIFLMYVGRVGILSFSIAFLTRSLYPAKIKYPEFNIMIG